MAQVQGLHSTSNFLANYLFHHYCRQSHIIHRRYSISRFANLHFDQSPSVEFVSFSSLDCIRRIFTCANSVVALQMKPSWHRNERWILGGKVLFSSVWEERDETLNGVVKVTFLLNKSKVCCCDVGKMIRLIPEISSHVDGFDVKPKIKFHLNPLEISSEPTRTRLQHVTGRRHYRIIIHILSHVKRTIKGNHRVPHRFFRFIHEACRVRTSIQDILRSYAPLDPPFTDNDLTFQCRMFYGCDIKKSSLKGVNSKWMDVVGDNNEPIQVTQQRRASSSEVSIAVSLLAYWPHLYRLLGKSNWFRKFARGAYMACSKPCSIRSA